LKPRVQPYLRGRGIKNMLKRGRVRGFFTHSREKKGSFGRRRHEEGQDVLTKELGS